MSVIVARCSKVLRSSFMENSKRCLDSARHDKTLGHVRANDADAPSRSSSRAPLKFCVRQTSSKLAEIKHEGHEGHKEFATDRVTCRASKIQATDIGLISGRFFTYIASCLRSITDRRGVRSVKALKTVPLHLPPRIGVWSWQRKANQQRPRRRWKSFAEPTGGHYMASSDVKATNPRKLRISLKLFLRDCSNGKI